MREIEGYEVAGKPVRWSWESMWALACPDHKPWIRAGYDLDYTPWLEAELKAFRDAYTLVQQTIDQWEAIYRLTHDLYAEQLISEQDFITESIAMQAAIHPDMFLFDPGALPDCLERVKVDGRKLAKEYERAVWHPPVTWT